MTPNHQRPTNNRHNHNTIVQAEPTKRPRNDIHNCTETTAPPTTPHRSRPKANVQRTESQQYTDHPTTQPPTPTNSQRSNQDRRGAHALHDDQHQRPDIYHTRGSPHRKQSTRRPRTRIQTIHNQRLPPSAPRECGVPHKRTPRSSSHLTETMTHRCGTASAGERAGTEGGTTGFRAEQAFPRWIH